MFLADSGIIIIIIVAVVVLMSVRNQSSRRLGAS